MNVIALKMYFPQWKFFPFLNIPQRPLLHVTENANRQAMVSWAEFSILISWMKKMVPGHWQWMGKRVTKASEGKTGFSLLYNTAFHLLIILPRKFFSPPPAGLAGQKKKSENAGRIREKKNNNVRVFFVFVRELKIRK